MGLLSWIFIGALAGALARMLVGQRGRGCLVDIIVGICGAVLGGAIFRALGGAGVTGFNIYSLIVATIGAVLLLALLNALHSERS
ncbi:MAG: GlsB/YeaQ/YmgE family stress response membrane protein [Armatimonadetes bacterium]|nr:GlsB/YeaQ/YmgE family stress response membrane protein [Armatimonadota bacterium]